MSTSPTRIVLQPKEIRKKKRLEDDGGGGEGGGGGGGEEGGGEKEEEENKAMFGQRLNYFGASLRAKESNGNWPVPFLLLLVCCF